MIKAVIFDCFGVLTTDGWKQIREQYFAQDEDKLRHAHDIDRAVNAGMMEYVEFITEISSMTGLTTEDVRQQLDGAVPNNILFEYIRDSLKPNYKIGMLSNAAADWLKDLFEPWQAGLFDEVVLSFETGLVKPDARIYTLITNQLGVESQECLFIDDNEHYCTAAEQLGITAIYHQDTHETIAKIQELLRA